MWEHNSSNWRIFWAAPSRVCFIILYVQYFGGCRDLNPSCFDCSQVCYHILLFSLIMLQLMHRSQYCVVCFCLAFVLFLLARSRAPPPWLLHLFHVFANMLQLLDIFRYGVVCLFALFHMLMLYFLYRFSYNKILNELHTSPALSYITDS